MNINLTPELEKLVHQKVATGLYNSASEVIREALRLMNERDIMRTVKLEALRKEISMGLTQADNGELAPLDIEQVKREGRKRLQKRT